ncbi:hypothetical protein [Mesorhizobium sp. CAU 1741]|uniref:hypothetical protein n=1 Tax=Mesorhizobium sp. CAU 1741 TaxID=3140366 RepID=UPI00325AAFD1
MKKILTAAALTFALTGAALAQVSATASSGEEARNPSEMMGAFYTDDTMTELRSTDEIRASWDGLSAGERQQLRDTCSVTTAAGGATSTETTDSEGMPQNMAELCEQFNASTD